MAILRSSDGKTFEVDEAVVLQLQTIDGLADNEIPLPNVTGNILAKVIEYCKKHADNRATEDVLNAWDTEFVKVDGKVLSDLITAANYLNIKSLLHLIAQTFADMIRGKTPEEIRKTLNIKNDFTPDEKEEVRRENAWPDE